MYTPPVATTDWENLGEAGTETCSASRPYLSWKQFQQYSSRGSKSRNKVSVGEPAEGSLTMILLSNKHSLAMAWLHVIHVDSVVQLDIVYFLYFIYFLQAPSKQTKPPVKQQNPQ